jgi:hypothetical protein
MVNVRLQADETVTATALVSIIRVEIAQLDDRQDEAAYIVTDFQFAAAGSSLSPGISFGYRVAG